MSDCPDLAILDDQYASLDEADKAILEKMLAAAEEAVTQLDAAHLMRLGARLLHHNGRLPQRRKPTLRVVPGPQ